MDLRLLVILTSFLIGASIHRASAQNFRADQMSYARVRAAAAEKGSTVNELFRRKNIAYPPKKIFIRIFKQERTLELWALDSRMDRFEIVRQYGFCASSGELGPKRRQGDEQIPEGFYRIDRFNPLSNFHLSLGISYPNRSDRILAGGGNMGGDIFIHGGCATIGCVPITDDGIKELYLIAVEARSLGQSAIPVHIFPTRLDSAGMQRLERGYNSQSRLLDFWRNLKEGFDIFERDKRLPVITIDRLGIYQFGR